MAKKRRKPPPTFKTLKVAFKRDNVTFFSTNLLKSFNEGLFEVCWSMEIESSIRGCQKQH